MWLFCVAHGSLRLANTACHWPRCKTRKCSTCDWNVLQHIGQIKAQYAPTYCGGQAWNMFFGPIDPKAKGLCSLSSLSVKIHDLTNVASLA